MHFVYLCVVHACCFSFLSSSRGSVCCFFPYFLSLRGAWGHAVVMVNDPFSHFPLFVDEESIRDHKSVYGFSQKNAPLEYLTIFRFAGFVHILGSQIQDHFQTFYQNNTFFFQTQCHQTWLIETLKDSGTKLFSWFAENVQARLSKIWPKRKRFHLKSTQHFTIFPDFSRSEDFFENSRLYEPWKS